MAEQNVVEFKKTAQLYELEPGREITILAEKDGKVKSFFPKVMKVRTQRDIAALQKYLEGTADFCVCEAIKHKKYYVKFKVTGVRYTVTAVMDRCPFRWNNVQIDRIHLPDLGTVTILVAPLKGMHIERRKGLRVATGVKGTCIFPNDANNYGIKIKDISVGGIGFYVKDPPKMERGKICRVRFKDTLFGGQGEGDKPNHEYVYDLRVMRVEQHEGGLVMLGCAMIAYDVREVSHYVNKKQTKLGLTTGGQP